MTITDEESAKAWLADKPYEIQVAFAARCATRSAPAIANSDSATRPELALRLFRAALVSSVAAVFPEETVREAARAAYSLAEGTTTRSNVAAIAALASASRAAKAGAETASLIPAITANQLRTVAYATNSAITATAASGLQEATAAARAAGFSACDADATVLAQKDEAQYASREVFQFPLWPEDVRNYIPPGEPDGLAENYQRLVAFFKKDPETWDFWHRWLEGVRNGQPMDWDLQEQVALLGAENDFKIWERGPEAVAEKIREIEARFDLKERLRDVESEMARDAAQRFGIGGNNPPEEIGDVSDWPAEITLVWEPIVALKEEVESEAPDKEKIRTAIFKLGALAKSCGLYFAQKADLAVDTAIKWGIPASATALVASHPELVSRLIESAQRFLDALP